VGVASSSMLRTRLRLTGAIVCVITKSAILISDWIGLSSVLRPLQHSILGYIGDGFYRSKDGRPNQQYQSTEGGSCKGKNPKNKENTNYIRIHTENSRQIQHTSITQQVVP